MSAAVATPKTKKVAKPKKPADHPKYIDMVTKAIAALKERGGSSRQAIVKYILANFNVGKDADAVKSRVKTALKRGLVKGALVHAGKGKAAKGATGSFKIGEKAKAAPKKKAAKAKKPKSPKKVKAKKPAGEKKAAKKPKSPKKAKVAKPAAKKAKTPKKKAAAKPAAPAAKKPAAKKSPKKKAAKKSPKKAAKKPATKK